MKELIEILERQKQSTKRAISDSVGKQLTYKELYIASMEFAKRLDEQGASKNILIYTGNVVDYVVALFGSWASGRTPVMLDEHAKENEILSIAKFCESNTIILSAQSMCRNFEMIKNNLYVDLLCVDNNVKKYKIKENPICFIGTTSGTTGNAKYVSLSVEGVIEEVINICKVIKYKEYLKELLLFPISSVSASICQLLVCLYLGEEITIYTGKFNVSKVLEFIKQEQPNYLVCTNSILALIVYSNKFQSYHLKSVEYVVIGGEAADTKMMRSLKERYPQINIMQSYGMTETSGIVCWYTENEDAPIKSVGRPMENFRVRVVSENGTSLINSVGEIEVSGKGIMLEYYRNEKATDEIKNNGWLKTGDLGYLDEDGFLYITGRKKNLIIISGKNVCKEEIETRVCQHPKISMVKAYAIKDEWTGEKIGIEVNPIKNGSITQEEVIEYCRKELKPYMMPKEIKIVDKIAMNRTNKIAR